MASYPIGSLVTCQGEFQHNGADADPASATITFKLYVDGTLTLSYTYPTDAQVVKSATGIYYVDAPTPTSGNYWFVWASTSTVVARRWDSFVVEGDPDLVPGG